MEFATDWNAVFNPQIGDSYFDRAGDIPFLPESAGFSAANAWWLAELSRWIYNVQGPRHEPRGTAREYLSGAGLREICFLSAGGTHAAVVEGVAAPHERPVTALVFRGSSEPRNWLTNLLAFPSPARTHLGYERALDQIWGEIEQAVGALSAPLFLTGHSMGGALAGLAANRLDHSGVYTFGAPRAANREIADSLAQGAAYRIVNYRDLAPGRLHGDGFAHIGKLMYVSYACELWEDPSAASVQRDRAQGVRALTGHRIIAIPERVSDHAPVNYVAHMERLALA